MLRALEHYIDPQFLIMLFAAIAAGATVLTLAMPLLARDTLSTRMKAVAFEREKIRLRERERLAQGNRASLRQSPKAYMNTVVQNFNLSKWVGQDAARMMLVQAGYRGHGPYVTYLFFRMVMPIAMLLISLFYVFVVIKLDQPTLIKIGIGIGAAYFGMLSPNLYLKNKIQRRQTSIKRAFPDALDLLLICIESGMSVEAAFQKVSLEVGAQSVELAEEFTLTTAELSYLPDRRQAYENLAQRVGHAARYDHAGLGAGKSRHAHVGSREEGRRPAAEAHRADDPVFPAGAVHRHSRSGRDQSDGDTQ
jgi:tight adherence protein C